MSLETQGILAEVQEVSSVRYTLMLQVLRGESDIRLQPLRSHLSPRIPDEVLEIRLCPGRSLEWLSSTFRNEGEINRHPA